MKLKYCRRFAFLPAIFHVNLTDLPERPEFVRLKIRKVVKSNRWKSRQKSKSKMQFGYKSLGLNVVICIRLQKVMDSYP